MPDTTSENPEFGATVVSGDRTVTVGGDSQQFILPKAGRDAKLSVLDEVAGDCRAALRSLQVRR